MGSVHLLTHSFLDGYNHDTTRIFGGGLERYIYDLCQLLLILGHQPVVHQLSYFGSFEKEVQSILIRGYTYDLQDIPEVFARMTNAADGPIIYGSCIWHPLSYKPGSLAICHGLNWDRHDQELEQKRYVGESIQKALNELWKIVSVDSHFLSFCRSACRFEDPEQVVLLPNSVDTNAFHPFNKSSSQDRVRVLFPRRLSYERGIIPMMLAADALLERYPEVEVEFAGERIRTSPIGESFRIWWEHHEHRERILHTTYTFEQMQQAYQQADVAVIPSIFSEGTSYSCLEALSCGLPVVASNVGGLNDLILDGYNGFLVTPTEDRLVETLELLLQNPALRRTMGERARQTALGFDTSIWRKRWSRILSEFLEKR